jgi:hypothetical protein
MWLLGRGHRSNVEQAQKQASTRAAVDLSRDLPKNQTGPFSPMDPHSSREFFKAAEEHLEKEGQESLNQGPRLFPRDTSWKHPQLCNR